MRVEVKVLLGSGKPEMKGGLLVVHTTEKLEKGMANRDVILQVSKFYNVPSSDVKIVSGLKSRRKVLKVITNSD